MEDLCCHEKVISRSKNGENGPLFIAIAGGPCSGKGNFCKQIVERLANVKQFRNVHIINQKSFYNKLNPQQKQLAMSGNYNYDHPNAFDDEIAFIILDSLKNGNVVNIPIYDDTTHEHTGSYQVISKPCDIVIFVGILVLYNQKIRNLMDLKIFIDLDSDDRLAKRVVKDTERLDRNVDKVIHQYIHVVKPSFDEFCLPTKKYADIIIPRGTNNQIAMDLIIQHIYDFQCNDANCTFCRNKKRVYSENNLIQSCTFGKNSIH